MKKIFQKKRTQHVLFGTRCAFFSMCVLFRESLLHSLAVNTSMHEQCLCRSKRPFHRSRGPPPPCRAVNVIQSHFAYARVLGTFSHTTCRPISFVLRTCFLDRSATGEAWGRAVYELPPSETGEVARPGVTVRGNYKGSAKSRCFYQ